MDRLDYLIVIILICVLSSMISLCVALHVVKKYDKMKSNTEDKRQNN